MRCEWTDTSMDPAYFIISIISDVARNPFSDPIKYFVMDPASFDNLRRLDGMKECRNINYETQDEVWKFCDIPIAVVCLRGQMRSKHFVEPVHGY